MAQVTVSVNGKPFVVGCEDGQESHLVELARLFDDNVSQVSSQVGQLGETRLFLMAALLLADDLADTRTRLAQAQALLARTQADYTRTEMRAVNALEFAAKKIEQMAAKTA